MVNVSIYSIHGSYGHDGKFSMVSLYLPPTSGVEQAGFQDLAGFTTHRDLQLRFFSVDQCTTVFLGEIDVPSGKLPVVPHKAVAEVSKIGNL